jgi:predicted transcriptional regulator
MKAYKDHPRKNRDFQEILHDFLKILKKKHPNPVYTTYLIEEGHFITAKIKYVASYAADRDLIEISTKMRGTREVDVYSITERGIRLTEAWSRYKKDVRALGINDLIFSKVDSY